VQADGQFTYTALPMATVARRIVIGDHRRRQARPIETADVELTDLPVEDDTAERG